MTIRGHLMVLVAVALLPVLIFAGVMIAALGRQERAAVERGLLDTARALSLAVDRELAASIRSLQLLAQSEHLQSGDLKKFHEQSAAILPAIGVWETVVLTEPSGQQVVNLRRPFGASLPRTGLPDLVRQVAESGKPAVSNLSIGGVTGAPLIAVAAPVFHAGKVAYVLSAGADPKVIAALLAEQKIPPDWLATVVDANNVVVARTRDGDKFVGKPVPQNFTASAQGRREATSPGIALDGAAIFAAASRSELSGWGLAVAVPASAVGAPMRRTILLTSLGGFLLLLSGLVLAALFGRRIAAAFAGLADGAAAMGRGEIPRLPPLSIAEANRLARAFADAAASRKRADEELQLSEERLGLAVIGAGLGTWHFDIATGELIWSERCREIFAVAPDAAINYEVFLAMIHPEDRERVDREVAAALREKKDYAAEFRIVRPDGSVRWITARGRGHYDERGNPTRMEGVVRDISERIKAVGSLQHALERIRALHEIGMAITSTLDLRRVLDILLERLQLSTSYTAATVRLVNRRTGELEPVACRNINEEKWKRTFSRTPGGLSELVLKSKKPVAIDDVRQDPRTRHQAFMREFGLVSFLGIPLIVKDEALGVLAVFSREARHFDEEEVQFLTTFGGQAAIAIHNAQIYEEMVGANKVKEEFLSVMSHELRTPLSVVMGYAGMLNEGILGEVTPRQQEVLQKILSRAAEQLYMINSIMQTTQLETRAVMPEYHTVNFSELLAHLRADLGMTHAKKDVALVWDYPQEAMHVVTDSAKVKQILQNLIGNALKFTDRGSVTVSVRLVENTGPHPLIADNQLIQDENLTPIDADLAPRTVRNCLQIKVADTGIGMTAEQQWSIFDKFFQVDSSETRLYGGVGLGLYIVKTFTELLGGKIEVESRRGSGTTFTVTIPVETAAADS
jgi:PAS domain S-box-containing protein